MLLGLGGLAGAVYLVRRLARRTDSAQAAPAGPPRPRPARPQPPGSKQAGTAVSRTFDSIFREYGRGIPLAYLRALAKRESNLNPREAKDPAWGLLQVIEVVRRDYNQRFGTKHTRRDLLDPTINVTIAADLLARIIDNYRRHHPNVPNLQEDWDNPRFVELLTFGWNAGYSERGGLGRVARYLEQRGINDITIDTIHQHARAAGATRHLANPQRARWSKSVASLYLRERDRDAARPSS